MPMGLVEIAMRSCYIEISWISRGILIHWKLVVSIIRIIEGTDSKYVDKLN